MGADTGWHRSRDPVGVAAVTVLSTKMQPLFELEDAALSGTDMDAVHDMRVASRRSREASRSSHRCIAKPTSRAALVGHGGHEGARGGARRPTSSSDHLASFRAATRTQARSLRSRTSSRGVKPSAAATSFVCASGLLSSTSPAPGAPDPRAYGFKKNGRHHRPAGVARPGRSQGASRHLLRPPAVALDESAIEETARDAHRRQALAIRIETFKSCIDPKRFDQVRGTITAYQDALGELRDRDVFLDAIERMTANGDPSVAGLPLRTSTASSPPQGRARRAVRALRRDGREAPRRGHRSRDPGRPAPRARAARASGAARTRPEAPPRRRRTRLPPPTSPRHGPARPSGSAFWPSPGWAQSLFGRRPDRELPPSPPATAEPSPSRRRHRAGLPIALGSARPEFMVRRIAMPRTGIASTTDTSQVSPHHARADRRTRPRR